MKKILLLLLIAMLFPMMVGAQNTGLQSVIDASSAGLYGNDLDAALTVDETGNKPAFSELSSNYIFAALANINLGANLTASSTAVGASQTNPLWGGCYFAGEMPWSLFVSFYASDATGNVASYTNYTDSGAPETVNNVTYYWNDEEITRTYTRNRLFDQLQEEVQFLLSLGDINTGLYLKVLLEDGSIQGNNYNQVHTYYDNPAGANVIPAPVVDYTQTIDSKDINDIKTFNIGIPLFMRTGDLAHLINFKTNLTLTDTSQLNATQYSATTVSTVNLADTTDTTNAGSLELDFDIDYTLTMPSLFDDNAQNEFKITPSIQIGLMSGSSNQLDETQAVTRAPNAAPVLGAKNETETTKSYGEFDFGLGATVSHSFYFEFQPGVRYGINPTVELAFTQDNPYTINSIETVVRTDNDTDQNYTSAVDSIDTTTENYTNATETGGVIGDVQSDTIIDAKCSLPMALNFKPLDWPVTIMLGSTPRVEMKATIRSTATNVVQTITETVDGAGAVTTPEATDQAGTSDTTSTLITSFVIDSTHTIGMSLEVGENVDLDIALNLSTASTNIFDIRDFVVQAIVKLPN